MAGEVTRAAEEKPIYLGSSIIQLWAVPGKKAPAHGAWMFLAGTEGKPQLPGNSLAAIQACGIPDGRQEVILWLPRGSVLAGELQTQG